MEKKMSTAPKPSTAVMPVNQVPTEKAPTSVIPQAVPEKPMEVEHHEKKNWCKEHMHRYVLLRTKDGYCTDGFIEHIDDEMVCLAVPHWGGTGDRAFFPFPSIYPYPAYPYPFFPRGRFIRRGFPLGALFGLSLLPFYF